MSETAPLTSLGTATGGHDEHFSLTNDYNKERYPCSIVWTPIPLITWLLPFVGHMGICNSEGVIHDFAGPFMINKDALAFGDPVKYWKIHHLIDREAPTGKATMRLTPAQSRKLKKYDDAVENTTVYFKQTQWYNFFTNNCHSFVAYTLEAADVGGSGYSWNMVKLAFFLFFCGRYVSVGRFMKAHLPFFIIVGIILALTI